jgi:TRAP-type C4-dicarboxylate transport system permease small subunit
MEGTTKGSIMTNGLDKQAPEPALEPSQGSGMGILPNPSKIWGRFGHIIQLMSRATSVIGIFSLVALIALTTVDVVGSKFFTWSIPGYIGVIELAQLAAISFAMAITMLMGQHIKVEILLHRIPERMQAIVSSFVYFLCFAVTILIIWRLIVLGMSYHASGEVVDQIKIPLYPFPYAVALAFLPVSLILLHQLGNSLSRTVRK